MKQNEIDIKNICSHHKIENYSINPDGSIDVEENVDMSSQNISKIPLIYRRVITNFNVQNNKLTTLNSTPIAVGCDFNSFNNQLLIL